MVAPKTEDELFMAPNIEVVVAGPNAGVATGAETDKANAELGPLPKTEGAPPTAGNEETMFPNTQLVVVTVAPPMAPPTKTFAAAGWVGKAPKVKGFAEALDAGACPNVKTALLVVVVAAAVLNKEKAGAPAVDPNGCWEVWELVPNAVAPPEGKSE